MEMFQDLICQFSKYLWIIYVSDTYSDSRDVPLNRTEKNTYPPGISLKKMMTFSSRAGQALKNIEEPFGMKLEELAHHRHPVAGEASLISGLVHRLSTLFCRL